MAAQESIDLKAIFRKLVAKWWLFLITCGLCGAAAVAYLKTTPKQYAVSGVMLMSEKKRNNFGAGNDEFLKGTSYLSSNGELEDQISVLMSYTNVLRTIERLDFDVAYYEEKNFLRKESYTYKPFMVRLDTSLQVTGIPIQIIPNIAAGTFRVKGEGKNVHLYSPRLRRTGDEFLPKWAIDQEGRIGEPFHGDHLSFSIEFPKDREYASNTKYTFVIFGEDGLASYFRSKTMTSPQSDESNIITITTAGEVVQKEKDFVDMLMRTYIEGEQDKHNEKGRRTIAFIDDQLGHSSERLASAQQQLTEAQRRGGVGSTGDAQNNLNTELFRQQDEETRIKGQITSLSGLIAIMSGETAGTPNTVAASGIDAPNLNSLIDQYNKDVSELRVRQTTERIKSAPTIALERKITTEREQIVQSAQALEAQKRTMLNAVQAHIGELQGKLYALPGADAQLKIATQHYDLNEQMNNYLMEKRYEAQIAVESDQVDKYVVDEARQVGNGPISPDKKVVLGGALLLGLLIPILFILIRDFFNDRIADLEELKRLTPIPILSTIPSSKRKRVTADEPKSLLAESFRTARINLQYLNADVPRQVVGMTSSTSGEGKTFCSLNLATVMAMSGKRTLLIDADMRRPRVHEYLELPEGAGLSTYLIGECGLDQVVRRTDINGLDVITAGPIPPNPLELMESPRLAELFQQMRTRYDQIVVDASPMGLVSEFKILMSYLDVTLYVVREGYTRRGMLRGLNELNKEGKIKQVDLLLNDVKAGDGYGDGYGYYTK